MKRPSDEGCPSDEDMLLAAEWLDENEGGPDESIPMQRVAEWLRSRVAENQNESTIKLIAKESGATISRARDAWNNRKKF